MTRTAEIEIEMVTTYDQDAQPLDYLFQDPQYREEDHARMAVGESLVGLRPNRVCRLGIGRTFQVVRGEPVSFFTLSKRKGLPGSCNGCRSSPRPYRERWSA